jgi:hypothetical protein
VARYADVWHADSLADYRQNTALVDRLAEEAARDPAAIGRAASLSLSEPWAEVRQNAELRRDLGMDYLVCSWPSEGRARVEEFWTTVAPDFAD